MCFVKVIKEMGLLFEAKEIPLNYERSEGHILWPGLQQTRGYLWNIIAVTLDFCAPIWSPRHIPHSQHQSTTACCNIDGPQIAVHWMVPHKLQFTGW